jgi:hypothetical protein
MQRLKTLRCESFGKLRYEAWGAEVFLIDATFQNVRNTSMGNSIGKKIALKDSLLEFVGIRGT